MELYHSTSPKNPKKRKNRSLERIIKEDYLPYVIAGVTLIFVIVFISGAISRAIEKRAVEETAASIAAAQAEEEALRQREQVIAQLIANADAMIADYNYEGAKTLLESYSGEMATFPALQSKYNQVVEIVDSLVEWNDLGDIPNLSFHPLIAEPKRAFADTDNASSYRNHHITCTEFSNILNALYENNYVLIDLYDLVEISDDGLGNVTFTPKSIRLPQGKKPVIITQTNVNYYKYMVDGDGDGIADQKGDGFASKLVVGEEGSVTAQYIDANGEVLTGDYDLVPILERFIESHPDFSYKGARAILGVTGMEGIFGYRIDAKSKESLGQQRYDDELSGATAVVDALKAKGYTIACYTYGNVAYGKLSIDEIQSDLTKWNTEIAPILPDLNIFVYAKNSQLSTGDYTTAKYTALKQAGFHVFLTISSNGQPRCQTGETYLLADRIMVTGTTLRDNIEWFTEMFSARAVRDPER